MLNLIVVTLSTEGVFWCDMRTLEWLPKTRTVQIIDQRELPGQLVFLHIHNADEMVKAIQTMAIRGAPALGVAGAFGIALEALHNNKNAREQKMRLLEASSKLAQSRPTAVNLRWGIDRLMKMVEKQFQSPDELAETLLEEAQKMAEEDIAANLRMAKNGASLIEDGDTIITHCNTGSLAAVDWGTALGAIRFAHEAGKKIKVLVDETRPRFQGAKLTAWECQQYKIPFEVITDNMAGFFLRRKEAQKVFFGADRVTRSGDVINKVGTYMLSLAAHANNVPVYPVFPYTTFDFSIYSGDEVPIEERSAEEVTEIQTGGKPIFPEDVNVRNPAFDVTPHELITALVTDRKIIYPPFSLNIE